MTEEKIVRSISIEAWCEQAREGNALPVTVPLDGESMRPLIRRGRDPVTIVPLQRPLIKGDVVLFNKGNGIYAVHRVWKILPGAVQMLGDNCWNPDQWVPEQNVLGHVVCYTRNGRKYRLDTPKARAWGRAWMALYPVRKCYFLLRAFASRCYRAVFPKKKT